MRIHLITPPINDLHTAYPATAFLSGFLKSQGYECTQEDYGIKLALRIFSRKGFHELRDEIARKYRSSAQLPQAGALFLSQFEQYCDAIEPCIDVLQHKNTSFIFQITRPGFFPEGPKTAAHWAFNHAELARQVKSSNNPSGLIKQRPKDDALFFNFGRLAVYERARYLATLFLENVAAIIRETVDPDFELRSYAVSLGRNVPTFAPIADRLKNSSTWTERIIDEFVGETLAKHSPELLGLTIPFPGNLYGAFRIAAAAKKANPGLRIAMGGGFVSCTFHALSDPAPFEYVDYICMDDGERPILCLLEHLKGKRPAEKLLRTYMLKQGKVVKMSGAEEPDFAHKDIGTPTYAGIDLNQYVSVQDSLNKFDRIERNGRWNKLMLAHGCYWKKCAFCDVHLDYIGRYNPASAQVAVERIEAVMKETGVSGFNFIDEAAPPALLRSLSELLIERKTDISWYCMVRSDAAFTPELARLMAKAGCVAVMSGIEVASDRILRLINKGTSLKQVAGVTKAFASAGITVFGFLMYGFPTQTKQELVDALEFTRQLFANDCIHGACWNRFVPTVHSPVAQDPSRFGVKILSSRDVQFSEYALEHESEHSADYDDIEEGFKSAVAHFTLESQLGGDVRRWFLGKKMPATSLDGDYVKKLLTAH